MIRNVLEHVGGIAAYPIISLLLFVAVFVGFTTWALRLSRQQVDHASRLPLENDGSTAEGETPHEKS